MNLAEFIESFEVNTVLLFSSLPPAAQDYFRS